MSNCFNRIAGVHIVLSMILAVAFVRMNAQSEHDAPSSRLEGIVVDPTGAIVPGANVSFESAGATYSAATAADGKYKIEVPEGRYEISVRKPGFCYRRAPFRIASSQSLTINAALSVCAIADVLTIENGVSRAHDELRPVYKEESIAVPCGAAEKLEMLIIYGVREEKADTAAYEGNRDFNTVVATYNNVTVYAQRIRFDRKSSHLYAQGNVLIENGSGRSSGEEVTLSFDRSCALTTTN